MADDTPVPVVFCQACSEPVQPDTSLTLPPPCTHTYCQGCLTRLCELTVAKPWLFPPRCCQGVQVPLDPPHLPALLGPDLVATLRRSLAEFLDRDKTYCSAPRCSAYLPPPTDQCGRCAARTCRRCKLPYHGGAVASPAATTAAAAASSCPVDAVVVQVKHLAKERGWRRCFQCQMMVEKSDGCDHMT